MSAKRRPIAIFTTCFMGCVALGNAETSDSHDLTTAGKSSVSTAESSDAPSAMDLITDTRNEYMEEVYVEGERIDPTRMDIIDFDQIYFIKERAAREFKLGRYEVAFPHLLMLARQGFKDAQARVGFIYLHGLGGQQQSNLKALGWLGVASTGTTRPHYRNLFNELMEKVPESQFDNVSNIVDEYRDKWDSEKRGVDCFHSNTQHIKKLTCRYDAEFDRHQNQLMQLALINGKLPWVFL